MTANMPRRQVEQTHQGVQHEAHRRGPASEARTTPGQDRQPAPDGGVGSAAVLAGAANPATLTGLQRAAGNRAVSAVIQRVPIAMAPRPETLFNQRPTAGQAAPRVYTVGGNNIDMSRGGSPEVVTITVRIRFVSRPRSAAGGDTGTRSVIPAGDPRIAWARNICTTAPNVWNNRGRLVGTRRPRTGIGGFFSPDPGGTVRLPLVFRATPVFDLTSPADKEISVFGSAVTPGGQQHPIDAAHYYMSRGSYPFTEEQIYAHEYGHLIGLADEYSQSNPQMHAFLHQLDPATEAARVAALDRETVRRSVLAALTRPLFDRLSGASASIAAVLRAGAGPVSTGLGTQLRAALTAVPVETLLQANLPPTTAALQPRLAGMVHAATRAPANTSGAAARIVAAEFAAGPISALIQRQYFTVLTRLQSTQVDLSGLGASINIEGNAGITATGQAVIPPSGLWAAASTGPLAASAATVADQSVGRLPTGRSPRVRPGTLIGQLDALPASWRGFATAAPAALGAAGLQSDISTALAAAMAARLLGAAPIPAAVTSAAPMIRAVNAAVNAAAMAAGTNAVRAFLASQITPVLAGSVVPLIASIDAEVATVMATPAGAVAAAAPRDPAIAAIASNMRTQLQAAQTAGAAALAATPAGSGATGVSPGATAPPAAVTYNTHNIMSDNSFVFRNDQMNDIAGYFNRARGLRRDREGLFHGEAV